MSNRLDRIPETSWEVFEECPECGVGPEIPCSNLKTSTSRQIINAKNPHRLRRMKKKNA